MRPLNVSAATAVPELAGMSHAFCTLFEGSYSIGAAALLNSLVAAGFKGQVFAGYRGAMPKWNLTELADAGVHVNLLPLATDYHLTNYKPHFMLHLLDAYPAVQHIAYCDPDIVITAKWTLLCDWFQCGVALCEDINSPVSECHPRRVGWRRHFAGLPGTMVCRSERYVNGGFVGVNRKDRAFVEQWRLLSEEMGRVIGGLGVAKIANGKAFVNTGFANCFNCSDQDALNATLEFNVVPASILGRDAMGFTHGEAVMMHAVGGGKPWERNFLAEAMRGNAPRMADKSFMVHASQPIRALTELQVFLKVLSIRLAVVINRVWKRA